MKKIINPNKVQRTEPPRSPSSGDGTPRPRLGLRYGANMESRARP